MYKYKPYIKKYWYCFILGPLFMMLEASGEFILPYISANIINKGAALNNIPYIIKNSFFMLIIAACMLVTGILGAYFSIKGSVRLAGGVRKDTFKKIQTFSFSNIDEFTTGALITYMTNDITQIQNFAQMLLRGMFRSPVMLVGALIMSFMLDSEIAMIILIVLPILVIAIGTIILKASPRYTVMQHHIDKLNINIQETITNERVIKSFVREDYEENKFNFVSDELCQKSTHALKMMLLLQPLSALAVNVTTLAVVWVAGKQIMIGNMELGTLTAFITYLSQILTALNFLANIVLTGVRAMASDRRISKVLKAEVLLNDDHSVECEIQSGSIEFKDVCFKYFKKNNDYILDHISLSINEGELVGMIGSTGSGKSTLVSLIPRLYDVDEGQILVDHKDVRTIPLHQLRDHVAMVLQKNTLFSGTIRENLQWGNEFASDEELIQACKIAQAHSFILQFPDGYETELVQGGANLSGGQRQRLCIARALLKKPKILILDDSTSAVDSATDASIRYAFQERLPGITKIIIAQRIQSVQDADKIIVLDHGKIVGIGKHDDLLQSCEAYQEIYWSQNDRKE